jgi:hypothetical protein
MTFAIAALRGFITNRDARGVWISDDFTMDGPRPTWTRISEGLNFNDGKLVQPEVMAVDPTYPYDIQYVIDNSVIFKRNGGAFYRILDLQDAYTIVGKGPYDPPFMPKLSWVTCDPAIPGRVYTVYSYLNLDVAWWHDTWQQLWPGGKVIASDDYGETWYDIDAPLGPVRGGMYTGSIPVVSRNALEIQAINGNIWVGASQPNLFGEGVLCYPKKGVLPVAWDHIASAGAFSYPVGSLVQFPWVKIDPSNPLFCYGAVETRKKNLYRVMGGPPSRDALQYTYETFTANYDLATKRSSDCHWINPTDSTDQIIINKNGQIIFATLSTAPQGTFTFDSDEIQLTPNGLATGNLNLLASDNYQSIYFTSRSRIYGLIDRESRTTIRLETAVPGQWTYAAFANYGLYVDPGTSPAIGHPYVFSVELGDNGTDDMASSGQRLMGSDSAFNTVQQADLHARDIKELTPTVHAPWPANEGEAPVSDGEKYVATPVMVIAGMVVRYHNDGSVGEVYEFSAGGLNEAGTDAAVGDKIEITGAGEIEGEITLADQVIYESSRSVIFTSTITSGYATRLIDFVVKVVSDDSEDCIGIIGGETGTCKIIHCDVSAIQSGSGNAYAISAQNGGGFTCEHCNLYGSSAGGDGYAGRSLSGKIIVHGGKVSGSTDAFYIGE